MGAQLSRWLQAAQAALPPPTIPTKGDRTSTEGVLPAPDPVLSGFVGFVGGGNGNEATPRTSTRATVAPPKPNKLPTAPRTCAVCGVADWQVSVKEPDGRFAHVLCLPQFRPAMDGTPGKMPPEGLVTMQQGGALGFPAAADLEAKP